MDGFGIGDKAPVNYPKVERSLRIGASRTDESYGQSRGYVEARFLTRDPRCSMLAYVGPQDGVRGFEVKLL